MSETKDNIVRFIKGECSNEEEEILLKEAAQNPDFKDQLIELKNIYIHENMPDTRATDIEFAKFKAYISQKKTERKSIYSIISKVTMWSAAAIVLVLLSLNLWIHYGDSYNHKTLVTESFTTLPVESVNTPYTAKGIKGETILPDGSKVMLNSDSKIIYPAKFSGATRDVEFSGEGYFEVKKDSLHPMVVRCNKNFKVVVYGTTFNIKTYNNDNNAKTTLISGAIKIIESIEGKEVIRNIAPNQTYTIKQNQQKATLEKEVDIEKVCQWKDGILSFDSTPLEEVAKILERWHGVHIVVKNSEKLNIPITAKFTTESIVQIMDLLKFSTGVHYEIKDNVVTIK